MDDRMNAVELKAGGKVYRLRLTTNSICRLEERAGTGIFELVDRASDPKRISVRDIRLLFWAALLSEHDLTEEEAGALMDSVGWSAVNDAIARTVVAAQPMLAEGGEGKKVEAPVGSTG